MDLYHPTILKHNAQPFHFYKMEDSTIVVEAYNEICGDQYNLHLKIDDNIISEISFFGYGCAVSKASTSMLMERLQAQSLKDAYKIVSDFKEQMSSDIENQSSTDNLNVLRVALKYPGREKCATLSWDAILVDLLARIK